MTVFLSFGGRADDKGLDILLEAAKLLIERKMQFKIRITDGTDTKTTLYKFFGNTIPNEIEIIPQTENISTYFHKSDWFISASRRETFSYAIAESMLSGTPILSSDIEGVSWSFKQPSVITFKSEDAIDLAKKMERIITKKLIVNEQSLIISRKYVLENYTADRWAVNLIQYYDSLCKKEVE